MGFPAIPVERISTQARRIDLLKVLLAVLWFVGTVLVGVPYVLGWLVGKAWLGVTLLGTALVEGWRDAGRAKGGVGT